ncbi:hypothetical protein I314_00391 [Cryptococcus bacillisporus CA1873]|uniref:Uncharacterized protein n=1 Tax=Cryptococcus bacillisporus CA1873 TaxID=1296111 RepID=A0ABR5BJE6_CRYGA|nr:hypothetical protein I314_00391 [Cryptococcus bacillisporus CA1873]|eukprot:KIR69284.1 hypothetical protein I314_00391 [Cryptococcus gattii CA1873]
MVLTSILTITSPIWLGLVVASTGVTVLLPILFGSCLYSTSLSITSKISLSMALAMSLGFSPLATLLVTLCTGTSSTVGLRLRMVAMSCRRPSISATRTMA